MSSIFISHSSVNNAEALALREWLVGQGWDNLFLDIDPKRGIVAADRWREALIDAGGRAKAALFVVTPQWLESEECRAELKFALGTKKPLIGIVAGQAELSAIPAELTSQWQVVDLTKGDAFDLFEVKAPPEFELSVVRYSKHGLESLRQGLLKLGLVGFETKSFPWPAQGYEKEDDGTPRAPWRGLRAIGEADAGVFFGRDGDLHRALGQLGELRSLGGRKLWVILGASGAGKSSFMRAGLLPRLRRTDREYLVLPIIRPEGTVITGRQGLVAALEHALGDLGMPIQRAALRKELVSGNSALSRRMAEIQNAAADALPEEPKAPTLILPLDQAEELFQPGATEAKPFTSALAETLRYGSETIVIATIRTDSYAPLQSAEPLRDLQVTFSLPPIGRGDYRAAIEGPAERLNETGRKLTVVPTLVDRLVADAEGADALPLLAFTLERLYRDYGGDGLLDEADYDDLGGISGAVEAAVEAAFQDPDQAPRIPSDPGECRDLLHRAFPLLVGINEDNGAALRRVALWDDIPANAQCLIERLIDRRLLRSDEDDNNKKIVEIAHEALLRQWRTLTDWLDQEKDNLRSIQAVERAAAEWQSKGRPDGWLLHRAERLTTAEALAANRPDLSVRWSDIDREYLGGCRGAENAAAQAEKARQQQLLDEQRRRVRWAVRLSAGALLLAALAGWQFFEARQQQEIAESNAKEARYSASRTLALLARQTGSQYPRQGLRQALEALHINLDHGEMPSLEAQGALRWGLANAGGRPFATHDSEVSVSVSDDDRWIVTATPSNVQLWMGPMATTDERPWELPRATAPARFSADGRWLVTGSTDPSVGLLWDLALLGAGSVQPLEIKAGSDGHVMKIFEFGPAGRWLVAAFTAQEGAGFRAWDLRAEMKSIELGSTGYAYAGHWIPYVSFSGDGRWLVAGAWNPQANRGDTIDPFLWRMTGPEPSAIGSLSGHGASVSSAVFSPDGALLATSSKEYDTHTFRFDTTVRIWDLSSPAPQDDPKVLSGHQGPIEALAFSPDSRWLVSARGSGRTPEKDAVPSVRIWDLQADDPASDHVVLRGVEGAVTFLAVGNYPKNGRDAQWLAAVSGSTGRLWNFGRITDSVRESMYGRRGGVDVTLPLTLRDAQTGAPLDIRSAKLSGNGRWLVVGAGNYALYAWDLESNDPTRSLRVLRGHEGVAGSIAISAGAQFVVSGSEDRTARLWSLVTAASSANPLVLRQHEAQFSPDGRWLASAYSGDGVLVWDLTNLAPVAFPRRVDTRKLGIRFLFSPDSRWLLAELYSPSSVLVFDLEDITKTPIELPAKSRVFAIAMSDDSRWIAVGNFGGEIRLWDIQQLLENPGSVATILRHHKHTIFDLHFSPDRRWLVSVDSERNTILWDLNANEGPQPQSLSGARPLRFSPNRRWLATSEKDIVHIWDLEQSPVAIGVDLHEHAGAINSIAFHPEEHRVVTAARGTPVRVWTLDGESPTDNPVTLPITDAKAGLSSDGRYVVGGNEKATRLWEISTDGTLRDPIELEEGLRLIDEGGRFVVTRVTEQSGRAIYRVWDLTAVAPLTPKPSMVPVIFETPDTGGTLLINPDGRWLLTETNQETRLWSLHLDDLTEIAVQTIGAEGSIDRPPDPNN